MRPEQFADKLEAEIKKVIRRLPRKFGTEVVRYSMQRFREQGWDGKPWQPRKAGSKNNKGRAILIKRGRLRRSIRITKIDATSVTIGSDVPYARIHNEGFDGWQQIRAHNRAVTRRKRTTFYREDTGEAEHVRIKYKSKEAVKAFIRRVRMPKRQFLGDSPYLRRNLHRIAAAEFKTALKPILNNIN